MDRAFTNGVIRLDTNPTGVYYSGHDICGSVIFDLDRPLKFSVLYIQFLGEATVLWSESEIETINGVEKHKLIKYVGHEEYFNHTQQLAGGTGDVSHLPAGGQSFPFRFQIPFTAPSSFKGEQGDVVYSMSVTLIYADPSIPKEEMKKNFQVVAPFDLNKGNPRIKEPIDLEFDEVYGCSCFWTSDPVVIRVRLPLSGYCPGQVIPVAVEIDNNSSIEITSMIFELLSRELYRSSRPVAEYIPPEKVLLTTQKNPVLAHSKRNFTCDIVVPDILPPYLENCGIIDVGYFIRVTIKMSGCSEQLQDEAEICLGLVPVRGSIEGEYVHPLAANLPTEPIPEGGPALTVPSAAAGPTGSTTSLQKSQYNYIEMNSYPTRQNPSGNLSYPITNEFRIPIAIEQNPTPSYEIGFKLERTTISQGGPPPYPTDNKPGNDGLPSYAQANFMPSAPPLD